MLQKCLCIPMYRDGCVKRSHLHSQLPCQLNSIAHQKKITL